MSAAFICIEENRKILYTSNLGDSRIVLASDHDLRNCLRLTRDHKPYHTDEFNRIVKAGGMVEKQRVNGLLAVSRALGDLTIKPAVSVVPTTQRWFIE
eukprot:UN33152